MSCCGNHDRDQDKGNMHHSHASKKLNWMMIVCCGLPIVLTVVLLLVNAYTGSSTNPLLYILLLICPLSHVLMMPFMKRKQ
ncbi:DUF2933 domain-containing protein [Paenibacillus glacialis]|uniref:DUF2933 domain-containing protein n=1 Tax=Paenibacillus glacialis TaxID=494026 RepID=A0A168P1P8_9BACL|nr:DUF2933 domain-containing protein [Paenibacillus glacialis]OAB46302.1 hypothetical protein PGLA_02680 [Paenibacillus glacialis]